VKPRIGVTRKNTGKQLKDDETYLRYHNCVNKAGGESIDLLPTNTPSEDLIKELHLSGIVLSGGGDLDPDLYHEEKSSALKIDKDRDIFELNLVRIALRLDMPLFAICRGMQMLNVACRGSLLQDIPEDKYRRHSGPKHTSEYHDVEVVKSSRLHAVLGKQELQVNSRHHQGITPKRLAERLVATAFAAGEDIVEAIEAPQMRWVLGVQWHPERVEDEIGDSFQGLFRDFVSASVGGVSVN
jgi:putative glutamine amidotransferase